MDMSEENRPTMLTYIEETPAQLAANIENRQALVGGLVDAYVDGGYHNIWIVACGSSSNASQCAKPFMMKYLDADVQVVPPNTFIAYKDRLAEDDFVFVVSQSGCSTNSIEALDKLRAMGRKAVGLTGNLESDFKDHADVLVDYGVGEEYVGYVTKGVTTLAEFLMLFAIEAGAKRGVVSAEAHDAVIAEMEKCPERHVAFQKQVHEFYDRNKAALTSMTVAYSCGFAQGYGIACEGALKIGETIQIPSFAYEPEEFNHGPNLQLTPNYTLFFIDDLGKTSDRLVQLARASHSVSDRVFVVTNNPEVDDAHALRLPEDIEEPLLMPLYVLPLFQILAYRATTDLHKWEKHPMFDNFRKICESKTASISKIMPFE